jgi:hypothetical protein
MQALDSKANIRSHSILENLFENVEILLVLELLMFSRKRVEVEWF